MTSGMAEISQDAESAEQMSVEHVTTAARCPACVLTLDLDDERPRLGLVRWKIAVSARIRIGTAVHFDCPNGHSSEDDPDLLKAFHSRRF
jgi:hypothetical protein